MYNPIITSDKKALKDLKHLDVSDIKIVNKFMHELHTIPYDGPEYKRHKGERLTRVEKNLGIKDFEIHSIELVWRMRMVYEYKPNFKDRKYPDKNALIYITDYDNHKYRGETYLKKTFSMKT